jgi:small-conductance mechanosensitive channel/CRP-like cAMP-binding protein
VRQPVARNDARNNSMGLAYFSAALLALTLVGIFVVRSRSIRTKLICEILLLVAIGGYLMLRGTTPLPMGEAAVRGIDGGWLRALAVVWWLVGARLVATVTVLLMGRDARSRQARLFSDLAAGAIYLTAGLIILNSVLDLPIRGLLATSGVIAIVLGLALQNTLGDVFSGIAVGLEQPFHVGDRVTIGDHAEGVIVQINWRSIRIQTDGEDLATIPNSIVAKSQIVNRSVPTERRAASVEIPTLSTARSETLIGLVQQAILLCPAILTQPAPSVTIRHVGARTTTLGVTYFVARSPELSTARGQLLRQVRRLFRHANIQAGEPASPASLLADLILFESLDASQIAHLAETLVPHMLDIGDAIFEQGSRGASLYVIRSGIFEIVGEEGGRRTAFGRIGPGEYIGEISMMTGDPRPVSVRALSSGEVLELPRSAIESLLGTDSALSAALERSVQRGLLLLDRDPAARACQPLDQGGTLLGRIRSFLHR